MKRWNRSVKSALLLGRCCKMPTENQADQNGCYQLSGLSLDWSSELLITKLGPQSRKGCREQVGRRLDCQGLPRMLRTAKHHRVPLVGTAEYAYS